MNKLYKDIIYRLKNILKNFDIADIIINMKNIEEQQIINLNAKLKFLNNVSEFNTNKNILKYNALNLMFSANNNFKNINISECDNDMETIKLLNLLTECVNILYNNREDVVLNSIANIIQYFTIITNNQTYNILYINNKDRKIINIIIIHSIYEKIKDYLKNINENISKLDNSYIGINNIPLDNLIRGDKTLFRFINCFIEQYMIESKYNEDFKKYVNTFDILEKLFIDNESKYNNLNINNINI